MRNWSFQPGSYGVKAVSLAHYTIVATNQNELKTSDIVQKAYFNTEFIGTQRHCCLESTYSDEKTTASKSACQSLFLQ